MWMSDLPPFVPFFIAAFFVLLTRGWVRNAIILATPARRLSISFPGTARLRHPFSLDDLEKRLRNIRTCRTIKGGEGRGDTGVIH